MKTEYFEALINNEDLKLFIEKLYYICLYLEFNDQQLRIPVESFEKRKFVFKYFKKNEFHCIDGFPKDTSACLMIIPAVLMRNNFAFNGIKSSVLILENDKITDKIK